MEQLLVHILGDFILQSDYLALNKSKRTIPCLIHVIIYTSCFLLLTTSWKALAVIGVTHFLIDRFHTPLKRFIWWRNHLNPKFQYPNYKWCDTTGYYDDSPYNSGIKEHSSIPSSDTSPRLFFITAWLYIVHDNFLHLAINYLALTYLV